MKESKKENRPLLPEEIEVRIDSYSDKSFTVVAYVNPRTSMFYLDDVYGPHSWSKKVMNIEKKSADTPFYAVCRLEITMPDGTVVVRDDVGQDFDSPKSAVSDSIKRAAMNFIPTLRALYTLPTLRIPVSNLGISAVGKENVKNAVRFKKFSVSSITFGDGATGKFVKAIQIADEETGDIVCEFTSSRTNLTKESEAVTELRSLMIQAGISEEDLLKRYRKAFKVSSLSEIADTENLLESAKKYINSKKATKAKTAAGSSINDQLKGGSKKKKEE